MTGFRGTYCVLITPFAADAAVNLVALRSFVDWQIAEGIHGLIALGSTGEFLSLSDNEKELVSATVIDQARGRVPVLVGTGAEDTREVVRLSRRAEAQGADGVMIIPPFYSTPTDDEIVHHYGTVAEAIGIPIMIYNNPAVANVDLRPPLIARLSQLDNCRYVKDSTLDVTRVRDIRRLCNDNMQVFGGILGFESFVAGAVGWTAVAANVIPGPLARLFELVVAQKDVAQGHELYLRHLPLIEFVGGQAYVAGTKALLAHMGFAAGVPRPPRLPLEAERDGVARRLVGQFGLAFPVAPAERAESSAAG